MSYCRWSTDNYKCDLYVYESAQGYVVHVAARRIAGDIPPVPNIMKTPPKVWTDAFVQQSNYLAIAERVDITLPHAGETFVLRTLFELRDKLNELRVIGYNFPASVITEVEIEIEERQYSYDE